MGYGLQFFSKSRLDEHKMCMNHQVSDTGSGEPLFINQTIVAVWLCWYY
jgi:hypothetical protein